MTIFAGEGRRGQVGVGATGPPPVEVAHPPDLALALVVLVVGCREFRCPKQPDERGWVEVDREGGG